MGPPAHHQVNRLATIAFQSVMKESFRRSGAFDAMVDFLYAKHSYSPDYVSSLQALCRANNNLIKKLLKTDLPRNLAIELGNCMVEYENSVLQFAFSLCSILECDKILQRDNIQTLCECISVNPTGIIDKQKSVLKVVTTASLIGHSSAVLIGFFCVTPAKMCQEYERRMAEGEHCPQIFMYINVDPIRIWQKKLTNERMEGHFYECVVIWGHWEALKHFFNEMDPSIRQRELSKAASCIQHHDVSVENILFFQKHMDHPTWLIFLKRHFSKIFITFLRNYRYKHRCSGLYSEVCEVLDTQVIYSCINAINDHVLELSESSAKLELTLADLEPLFISLWQLTPASNKTSMGNTFFKLFKTLLRYRKYNAVTALIKDEDLTAISRNQLAGCAVIGIILDNDHDSLLDFLKNISPEGYVMDSVKDELLTPANLSTYMAFIGCCDDVATYERVLQFKYPELSIEVAKKCLLLNGHIILQALREGFVSASRYEAFLYWVFDDNGVQVDQYVKTGQQPPNLLIEIYKAYMMISRQSFHTIPAFQQSEEMAEKIKREIAKDQSHLHEICFELMLSKDYAALPRMLSVFASKEECEQFMTGFFLSSYGVEAIYTMIYSPACDSINFFQFFLKNKINEFLEFKEHWILSPRVCEVLELVMDGHGRAQLVAQSTEREPVEEMQLNILPHESAEGFARVHEGNIAIFKSIVRNSILGDMFCTVANAL